MSEHYVEPFAVLFATGVNVPSARGEIHALDVAKRAGTGGSGGRGGSCGH